MNEGPRAFRAGTVSRKSVASASSVFGGKNSNEMVGSGRAYSSGTRKRFTSSRPPGHLGGRIKTFPPSIHNRRKVENANEETTWICCSVEKHHPLRCPAYLF